MKFPHSPSKIQLSVFELGISLWCSRYSCTISSVMTPVLQTPYPMAQKCLPQYYFRNWGYSSCKAFDVRLFSFFTSSLTLSDGGTPRACGHGPYSPHPSKCGRSRYRISASRCPDTFSLCRRSTPCTGISSPTLCGTTGCSRYALSSDIWPYTKISQTFLETESAGF